MAHFTRYVGTNVLLVRGGKVLLHRRANTGWADGTLGIPGGHLEQHETARQAAVREIYEELGLDITQDRLIFYTTSLVRTNQEHVYYEFWVELGDNEEPANCEPEKCSELVWCDPAHLPDDVQDTFRVIIEQGYVKKRQYIEIGYEGASSLGIPGGVRVV